MVDKQYQFVKRQITGSATTISNYLDGCMQNRSGCFRQWSENRWCLEQYGKDATYQHSGFYLPLLTFIKATKKAPLHLQIDSISIQTYLLKMWGTFRGNLNIFVEQKYLNNSGVSAQQIELCSRPRVLAKNRFLRVEKFFKNMSRSSDIRKSVSLMPVRDNSPSIREWIVWPPTI